MFCRELWHTLVSLELVSQAESIRQGEFLLYQACHLLLTHKINLAGGPSWLGSVQTVLIADGAHCLRLKRSSSDGEEVAQGWRLLQGEERSIETRWFTLVVGSSKASLIMLSGPLFIYPRSLNAQVGETVL